MRAGEMRHVVEVQEKTATPKDSMGGTTYTWVKDFDVRAKVINLTGGKLEAARQIDIKATVEIQTRFCGTGGVSNITVANQLVYNSRIFEIVHVNDVFEQHRELILTCKEQIPGAD